MGDIQETVRIGELSKMEQRIVREYSTLVIELFSENSTCANVEKDEDNRQYNPLIRKFLTLFATIFSVTPIKSVPYSAKDGDKDSHEILNQSINKFRSTYRSGFRGVYYLACTDIDNTRQLAENEAKRIFDSLTDKFKIFGRRRKQLETIWRDQITQESEWINKVNTAKKTKLLDSVKSEVLESFKKEIEDEFPQLFNGSEVEFYDEANLFVQYTIAMKKAKQTFREEIPFEEEENIMDQFITEFENELKKVVDDLVWRNSTNKKNTKSIMTAITDRSLGAYKDRMSAYVENAQLLKPSTVLERHHELKNELVPNIFTKTNIVDRGIEELQVEYMNHYHKNVHQVFGGLLNAGGDKAKKSLLQCHSKSKEITKDYLNMIRDTFEEFQIEKGYVEKLQKSIEQDLALIIGEIRDASLANSRNIENLLEACKPTQILTEAEKEQKEIQIVDQMKTHYVTRINSFHSKSKVIHEMVKTEVIKSLQIELNAKIREGYANDRCIKALQDFADNHWLEGEGKNATTIASIPNEPNIRYGVASAWGQFPKYNPHSGSPKRLTK